MKLKHVELAVCLYCLHGSKWFLASGIGYLLRHIYAPVLCAAFFLKDLELSIREGERERELYAMRRGCSSAWDCGNCSLV